MRLLNLLRITIFFLIALSFGTLIVILFFGGEFHFLGIEGRVRPASAIIILCVLIAIAALIKNDASLKENFSKSTPALLFCTVMILYVGNFQTFGANDTTPARYLPFSILRQGNFDLDELPALHKRPVFSGLVKTDEHYVSSYPVGAALFAIPFYIPSVAGKIAANSWISSDLEKLAASCIVLLSAIIFYLTLLRVASRNIALLITAIYTLATSSFSVSSQALWQHGPSQLCLSAALYCIVRGATEPGWTSLAGFPSAFAVVCRPTDLLLVAPIALFVLFHRTRQFPLFFIAGIPPVLFQLFYNKIYFHDFFRTQWDVAQDSFWSTPVLQGLANILFSPARGLLIYSPIFVFSFVGIILSWRKGGKLLFRYLSVGVIAILLLYSKFFMWWGGYTYGPRLLADLSPILCLFLLPVISLLSSRFIKAAFVVLALWSFCAHAIGTYANDPFWNFETDIDLNPKAAWIWNDNQLINAPRRGFTAMKISLLKEPTTLNHPELFGAEIKTDLPELIEIQPGKKFSFPVEAINTGKAVWNYGGHREKGNVIL
ncbi:MAG TPA: hypothetical protein VLH08_07625, partial [Acidobacteriota bacterium]|nr:hypothetical protein [Acidobacteriota bacterium]